MAPHLELRHLILSELARLRGGLLAVADDDSCVGED
eukprot:CAMPEP_0185189260 /NCGR_PEP_ID=MMETSP1140-20130426/5922_1 /TAXON_ID=298111 /ORGANISM="Pavlova sp., Strain CCMP459" /LENGTH=35 /DNA_ID= /DNA_START= /DNA_END= /DNA_ORIENTATION=